MRVLKWRMTIVVLAIAALLVGCSKDNTESNVTTITTNSSQSEEVKEGYIRITVSKDNGSQYITEEEISVEDGENLLDLMTANFFIEQSSGNITSIERVKANDEENTVWKYFVNGKESDMIPRDYIPSSGEKIVFDLQEIPNDNADQEETKESVSADSKLDYRILHTKSDKSTVLYAAIPDDQFQYVIPISFVISNVTNQTDAYNGLEQYLKENKLIDEQYLLRGMTYEIREEESQVHIHLPEEFSINSSAEAYMFEKLLATMFIPIGIEKVTFEADHDKKVELGPLGEIDELILNEEKSSFKLYNDAYLIPIPSEELSIEEAIFHLKEDQREFNVTHTIPEDINFSVESLDNKLELTYDGPSELGNIQEVVIMIESILMTAKTYGFEYVSFNNMPLERAGNYLLLEEIKVPVAVNPIVIQ